MRIVISSADGDILSQEIIDTKGNRVSVRTTHKKNFLKENCGETATPMNKNMSAAVVGGGDLENMSSQEAYNAGYNDAISEIMNMISEMMPGEIPVDMAIPVDIVNIDQLEEES